MLKIKKNIEIYLLKYNIIKTEKRVHKLLKIMRLKKRKN